MSSRMASLTKVRFEHELLPELGMHCITSPDIPGFHIKGKTYGEAEREALAMPSLIQNLDKGDQRRKLALVEFEAA